MPLSLTIMSHKICLDVKLCGLTRKTQGLFGATGRYNIELSSKTGASGQVSTKIERRSEN